MYLSSTSHLQLQLLNVVILRREHVVEFLSDVLKHCRVQVGGSDHRCELCFL